MEVSIQKQYVFVLFFRNDALWQRKKLPIGEKKRDDEFKFQIENDVALGNVLKGLQDGSIKTEDREKDFFMYILNADFGAWIEKQT